MTSKRDTDAVTYVTPEDYDRILRELDDPPAPNQALIDLMRRPSVLEKRSATSTGGVMTPRLIDHDLDSLRRRLQLFLEEQYDQISDDAESTQAIASNCACAGCRLLLWLQGLPEPESRKE